MDPGERQELMRSLLERFEALQQSEGSDAAANVGRGRGSGRRTRRAQGRQEE